MGDLTVCPPPMAIAWTSPWVANKATLMDT